MLIPKYGERPNVENPNGAPVPCTLVTLTLYQRCRVGPGRQKALPHRHEPKDTRGLTRLGVSHRTWLVPRGRSVPVPASRQKSLPDRRFLFSPGQSDPCFHPPSIASLLHHKRHPAKLCVFLLFSFRHSYLSCHYHIVTRYYYYIFTLLLHHHRASSQDVCLGCLCGWVVMRRVAVGYGGQAWPARIFLGKPTMGFIFSFTRNHVTSVRNTRHISAMDYYSYPTEAR